MACQQIELRCHVDQMMEHATTAIISRNSTDNFGLVTSRIVFQSSNLQSTVSSLTTVTVAPSLAFPFPSVSDHMRIVDPVRF